jgi:hypothetical protein
MGREEIVRWFRRFRYDPEFRGAVPVTRICAFAGVPRDNLYRILRGDLALTENSQARLATAIRAVESGLRWRKRGRHWEMVNQDKFQALPRFERGKHRPAA